MREIDRLTLLIATETDECIIWDGHHVGNGYGVCRYEGKAVVVHKIAWKIKTGSWPVLTLDHLCRIRDCINVRHLEDVSMQENYQRACGVHIACLRGHLYTPENTIYQRQGKKRLCRTCERMRSAANNARLRELNLTWDKSTHTYRTPKYNIPRKLANA